MTIDVVLVQYCVCISVGAKAGTARVKAKARIIIIKQLTSLQIAGVTTKKLIFIFAIQSLHTLV